MNSVVSWFCARQGHQAGPYPPSEIKTMIQSGQLLSTDFVWSEGMPAWLPVSSVFPPAIPANTLAIALPPAPPNAPLPPPSITINTGHTKDPDRERGRQNNERRKIETYISIHRKSFGIALLLSVLFGPFGIFYVSISAGVIFTILSIALVAAGPAGLVAAWIINLVATIALTSRFNTKLSARADLMGS